MRKELCAGSWHRISPVHGSLPSYRGCLEALCSRSAVCLCVKAALAAQAFDCPILRNGIDLHGCVGGRTAKIDLEEWSAL